MIVLVTLTVGLVFWITMWGFDLMKSFDAFLIMLLVTVSAAAVQVVSPYVNQLLGRETGG